MRYGFRAFDKKYRFCGARDEISALEASCNVRNCAAVPRDIQPMVREIHDLKTPTGERGKGKASFLLSALASEADKYGISLLLLVDQANRSKLCTLYARFGFIITQDDEKACVMIRNPTEIDTCRTMTS
jgi:N-acetylglutamate synthase-like GNAT family acetyltransferase